MALAAEVDDECCNGGADGYLRDVEQWTMLKVEIDTEHFLQITVQHIDDDAGISYPF